MIRWTMSRFRHYFFGATFTACTDCFGLKTFFDDTDHASHIFQRWKAELLQFGMEIEHMPAQMMCKCDMLSRYNAITESWIRTATAEEAAEQWGGSLKGVSSPASDACMGMVDDTTEPPPVPMRLSTLLPLCYSGATRHPTMGTHIGP